jgi:hypothetical protein
VGPTSFDCFRPSAAASTPDLWFLPPGRGHSSVGRAPALQAGGRRFDPVWLHQSGSTSLAPPDCEMRPRSKRTGFRCHRGSGLLDIVKKGYAQDAGPDPRRRRAPDKRCGGITAGAKLVSGDPSSLTASSVGFISMQTGLSIGGARQPRRSRKGATPHGVRYRRLRRWALLMRAIK